MTDAEQRIAEEARLRDEAEQARAEQSEKNAKELQDEIVQHHSATKGQKPSKLNSKPENDTQSDKASNFSMLVKDDALDDFKKQQEKDLVEVPPTAQSRRFNECDIIGNLERDEKGNVVNNLVDEAKGQFKDKDGKDTNQRGYVIDPATGDVINNHNGATMFKKAELDERGEVPAPFNVEKHNFNPHRVRGDFEHDRNGKPIIAQNDKGNFVDKRGKRI